MSDTPATPVLSATILLLRDGSAGMEVLMVKRNYQIDFAAGALVFPGGKACEDDYLPDWVNGTDGAEEGLALAAQVAAIRECFEEAGVLLARHETERGIDGPLVSAEIVDGLQSYRAAVDRGEHAFSKLMKDNGLVLACDTLVHFGHWITPDLMPKRFDTHFYVAAAPVDQIARQDGREATLAAWLRPQEALDKAEAGQATIIFPTRMNLGRLALAKSSTAALEKFDSEPVVTVLPKLVRGEAGGELVIPFVEGYGQTREPVEQIRNVQKPKS